jgi:hypothetical protein
MIKSSALIYGFKFGRYWLDLRWNVPEVHGLKEYRRPMELDDSP